MLRIFDAQSSTSFVSLGGVDYRGGYSCVERYSMVTARRLPFIMITAVEALARLRDGNRRFVANQTTALALSDHARRAALVAGQEPFAIVLGCSDSRVPAELVFDQGFGDLFVIRVAGNIVAPSQVGSVEFAAARFGTRLIVVMGHSQCGAVIATLEELLGHTNNQSRNLRSIVDRVRPSVEALLSGRREEDVEALVRDAIRANVRASVNHLRHGSELLEQLIRNDGLLVVGAEYSIGNRNCDILRGRFRCRLTCAQNTIQPNQVMSELGKRLDSLTLFSLDRQSRIPGIF